MSIYAEIIAEVNQGAGRLFSLGPSMPGASAKREVYISADVKALLNGPWVNDDFEIRCGYLAADFDRFITGATIAVAATAHGSNAANLKRLHPPADEVWELRCRNPKPGIRVFGRFAAKDVLVALTWATRPDLGGPQSKAWRDAKESCNAEWRKLFPAYPPFSGAHCDDYLSNAVSL